MHQLTAPEHEVEQRPQEAIVVEPVGGGLADRPQQTGSTLQPKPLQNALQWAVQGPSVYQGRGVGRGLRVDRVVASEHQSVEHVVVKWHVDQHSNLHPQILIHVGNGKKLKID